jgi:hypothetical protein
LARSTPSFVSCWKTETTLSASGYGSGLKSTPLTTEKMAVFAPMPSASVTTATAAKPGRFKSVRKATRTSCHSVPIPASS